MSFVLGFAAGARPNQVRAQTVSAIVPLNSGALGTLPDFGLAKPITYAKTGGSSNLSLSGSSYAAAVALAAGASQSMTGTATGNDGCVLPWTLTCTGQASSGGGGTGTSLPNGVSFGVLAHSYGQNGITGGTSASALPLIKTNVSGIEAWLEAICPYLRYEKWWGFQYATMNLGSGTNTFAKGDLLTQASNGATGTIASINYSAGAGNLTLKNVSGTFTNGAVTSSSGGSATASNVLMQNYRGANQSISGDYLTEQNGTMGLINRVNALMTLPKPPRVVLINGALNSIINGVAGATAGDQTKAIVDALQAHANWQAGNIIIILDCNPTTSVGYAGSSSAARQRTSDYNAYLRANMPSWPGYGTTLFRVSLFEALIANATGDEAADNASYVAGTNFADANLMYDANHIAQGGAYKVAKQIKAILDAKVADTGNFWKANNAAATAYNGATWTAQAGTVSGALTTKALGSQASGSAVAGVVTGLTITGSATANVKCYLEPGTGLNGAPVGQFIQCFEYTNTGNSDSVIVQFNSFTNGPGASGQTSWVQFQQDIAIDASGVFSGVTAYLSENNSDKAVMLECDATAQGKAVGLPAEAMTLSLLTPTVQLSGTQPSIKTRLTFRAAATRTGSQTVKVYPTGAVKVVADPTI